MKLPCKNVFRFLAVVVACIQAATAEASVKIEIKAGESLHAVLDRVRNMSVGMPVGGGAFFAGHISCVFHPSRRETPMAGKKASLTLRLELRTIQPPANGKYVF